ncbi:M23 family metallopeptidase [Hwanghaeella grinnelliae]|uniref:M23 family metallopeptidase n=1 Tax=Hwanghaeella grinnelliae TaxID=2500179 RepID=A0A3S2VMJ5_9PROT|nr:M23 family metallopeptidase [Hwanghaeella grinnelliae]RVU33863.1 M23 family metallopeptidase [Hwanghaeella grinnelliae]
MRFNLSRLLAAFLLVAAVSSGARAQNLPPLEFPADCRIGGDCWILSFVDLDSSPTYQDHHCGPRTYEGHKGTDIALIDAFNAAKTVPIRAAAGGTITGVRDGVPDNKLGDDIPDQQGRECGNGVRIDHGGGWFTQYCHLKLGSIRVSSKQTVEAGDVLGLIGNSGLSETPHLHFQLSHGTDIVDPFNGHSASSPPDCGRGTSLWSEDALAMFGDYDPTFIRHAGFAVTVPTLKSVQKTPPQTELPGNRSALVLYAVIYGLPEGSSIQFTVTGPQGDVLITTSQTIPRNKARQFQYAGKKTPPGGWPPGDYTGVISVFLPPPFEGQMPSKRTVVTLK